jgi:hypothetical protein
VAGGDDQIVDIASNATLLATNIPGAKLTILPAAGRLSTRFRPSDPFLE